ncbi:Uncharacterised protein [Segatella copri]|nr:Uncharacterised protein [Segatella copri]
MPLSSSSMFTMSENVLLPMMATIRLRAATAEP